MKAKHLLVYNVHRIMYKMKFLTLPFVINFIHVFCLNSIYYFLFYAEHCIKKMKCLIILKI